MENQNIKFCYYCNTKRSIHDFVSPRTGKPIQRCIYCLAKKYPEKKVLCCFHGPVKDCDECDPWCQAHGKFRCKQGCFHPNAFQYKSEDLV